MLSAHHFAPCWGPRRGGRAGRGEGERKKKKTQLCRKTNQKTQKMRRELPEPKQQNQEDIHITAPRSERLLALIEYVSI